MAYVIFFFSNGFVTDIPWKKVWPLHHKYFITNKWEKLHSWFIDFTRISALIKDFRMILMPFCLINLHLFWNCSYTTSFWCDMLDFIKCYVNPTFEFTYGNVIFGFQKCEKRSYLLNLFFLTSNFSNLKWKCILNLLSSLQT